jgi:fructose/tagatose bisphosphate aldolase
MLINSYFCFKLKLKPTKKFKMAHNIKPGVATGDQVQGNFQLCRRKRICSTCGKCYRIKHINGVLETAAKLNAPVIINFLMEVRSLMLEGTLLMKSSNRWVELLAQNTSTL